MTGTSTNTKTNPTAPRIALWATLVVGLAGNIAAPLLSLPILQPVFGGVVLACIAGLIVLRVRRYRAGT